MDSSLLHISLEYRSNSTGRVPQGLTRETHKIYLCEVKPLSSIDGCDAGNGVLDDDYYNMENMKSLEGVFQF